MMHDLSRFDRQLVRLVTEDGLELKGFVDYYSADYGRDEFGVEEVDEDDFDDEYEEVGGGEDDGKA